LTTGAPHRHFYVSEGISNDTIEVFCIPKNKTFLLESNQSESQICSKYFIENNCAEMVYGDFFNKKMYETSVRMSDRKFHSRFKSDTLKLIAKGSKEEQLFLPIE
jgi:hypothetical protein